MFDFKVEIILFLKSAENVSVGFFVKRIPSIQNFKAKILIFQKGIGCAEALALIEIPASLTLLQIVTGLV